MNKVILLGRVTKDPELKYTPNNVAVISFTVAVNRPFSKDRDGSQADFIDCVAWRNTAEFVSKYFSKGKPILVEGRIQVRSYEDRNGSKRKAVEVVCDNVNFVEGAARDNPPRKLDVDIVYGEPSTVYSSGTDNDFREVEDLGDLPF